MPQWWREVRGPDISARSRQETLTGLTAEQGSAASSVEEEVLAFRNILDVNLGTTIHSRKDTGVKIMSAGPIATGCLGCWREPGNRGSTYLAGVRSCRQYRKLMRTPCSAILLMAASVIATPSVEARMRTMREISSASYGVVGMMRRRAKKSGGIP